MTKQYEVRWDEEQVWSNTAFITADSEEEVEEKFAKEEFDHPISSEYSHTECIRDHTVYITELIGGKESSVSSNP